MGTLSETQYEELQSTHADKRLARVDMVSVGTLVFRQPTPAEYRLFKSQVMDNAQSAIAYDNLFARTAVYPSAEELTRMLADRPGIANNKKVITALNRLSGVEDEEEGKG
jgi:hypothetical protein